MSFKEKSHPEPIRPGQVAAEVRAFLAEDREAGRVDQGDVLRWGRAAGLDATLRRVLEPEWRPRAYDVTGEALADAPLTHRQAREAMHQLVSYHPDTFQQFEGAVGDLQRLWLKAQADKLGACGTTWRGHVVRVFWRDRKGRERLRKQVGIHRCKGAWCPSCGRTRQAIIAGEVEKLLVLAEDWGFHTGHARLVTLTSPNGDHLPTLREGTHEAFARLQRTRWWNRHVFGFVRGSEVVTGEDGRWNFHIHLLVIFWHPRMDYAEISDAWTRAMGGKRDGKNYVCDVESLERGAWKRKDGGEGPLARRNLARAARYISKYISKPEELAKLKAGPGGLGHLLCSTKGMRRAAFGGGCAVLRRTAHVLMPRQLHQAEEILAGGHLHEGRTPIRVEVMNPETGELVDLDPTAPDEGRTAALRAWGEALETNPEPRKGWKLPARVVGIPCGERGRHRRIGDVPMASPQPTVKAFERWEAREEGPAPLEGVRALVSGGRWRVYRWDRWSKKRGKLQHFAAVLPASRFAWRPIQAAVLARLGLDRWAPSRAKANAAHAGLAVGEDARTDTRRHLRAGVSESTMQARALRARFESELGQLRWEAFTGRGSEGSTGRIEALARALTHLPQREARPEPERPAFRVDLL